MHLSGSRGPRGGNDAANEQAAGGSEQAPLGGLSIHLEDRLLVALARRGDQRIGQFIDNALGHAGRPHECIFYFADGWLVRACEDYANEIDPERAA